MENKFKVGDRVILIDPNWNHIFKHAVVFRSPKYGHGAVILSVRFDNYDYRTPNNAHSGWTVDEFILDIAYYSPLWKALQ